MGNFRTSADLFLETLQKSGEVQNGNSQYQTIAMTYLNKVHHAIIAGGNLFDITVDENWAWARSRYPFSIDLQPAVTTGTVTMTQNDFNGTFSVAPTVSVEGWQIQCITTGTVYRITSHAANATAFQIDSGFVDLGGVFNFRCFKLEYDLVPSYLYISNANDRLDFAEVGTTQLTASLPHGSYTPQNLATQLAASLNAAGTNGNYSASYDSVLRYFTITSSLASGKIFSLLGASGTNSRRSALGTLGLDMLDASGAASYTSTYIVNGISRLIEPFKINPVFEKYEPFITSSDPYNMELDFPTALTPQRAPDKFCKISSGNDGRYVVRFNAYPTTVTKCLIDWIPVPIDLQNNSASVPLIPRDDADVLIHGAAMFVTWDKQDGKWQDLATATKTQLESMKLRNRSELFRTGPNFGQIIPRLDHYRDKRRFRYGYTAEPSALGGQGTATPNTMVKVTLTFGQFQGASTTMAVTGLTLAANQSIFDIIANLTLPFAGTGLSALNFQFGTNGNSSYFISNFNGFGAANSQASSITTYFPASASPIIVTATSTGGNLSALTAGQIDLYLNIAVSPS